MKSWYEILEVPESASTEQIRSAYLKLAREYHPDRVPEHLTKLRADAEDKFKQIQQAWALLGDPAKRRQYHVIGRQHAPENRPKPAAPYPPAPAVAPESLRGWLHRQQDVVKWSLLALITTLGLVVIGEVIVSRQSNATRVTTSDSPELALMPVPADIREFNLPPRHIQTWHASSSSGLEVRLLGIATRANEVELSFRVKAGEHGDLLLYEPPGASGRTKRILGKDVTVDRELGELYLEDSSGGKCVSTTGFVGGQQTNFNLYNFTRRINFKAHEEALLLAKFPAPARGASSVTFVSPALGKWQPEWRWPGISLK